MIELHTPNGLSVEVPETKAEDNTPRFNVNEDMKNAVSYYKDNGYVIFSSCVSQESCNQLRNLWEKKYKILSRNNLQTNNCKSGKKFV